MIQAQSQFLNVSIYVKIMIYFLRNSHEDGIGELWHKVAGRMFHSHHAHFAQMEHFPK